MRFGILGTGVVGRTIAARLDGMRHEVMVGTRDPEGTASRAESDTYGNPPFSVWQEEHPEVRLATFSEASAHGEMVSNATSGTVSLRVLELASETNLNGKILNLRSARLCGILVYFRRLRWCSNGVQDGQPCC